MASPRLHSSPAPSRPPAPAARQHVVPEPRYLARPVQPSSPAAHPSMPPSSAAAASSSSSSSSSDSRAGRARSVSGSATLGGRLLDQDSLRRKRGATNDPPSARSDATPRSPSAAAHLSLVSGRGRPKSPRFDATAPRAVSTSSSSCPGPRGATAASAGPSRIAVSKIAAEGEVQLGQRRADEALVELRDGRSLASSDGGDDDENHNRADGDDVQPVFTDHLTPYVFDCTMPVPLPDLPPSHSLPSPRNSPPYRSPLLRPSPLRIHSSPTRLPTAAVIGDSLPVQADASTASPTPSQSSFALDRPVPRPAEHRTRDSSASSSFLANAKDEKRRRRASADPVAKVVQQLAQRPPLHTYTSFEAAFDLHPPPSPPPSPKAETRSWWGLGA